MFGFDWFGNKEQKWEDFEAEVMPFLPDLFRLAVWLTRSRTDAEDLVQETLAAALRSFHRFEIGTNCRAWLTTIMYNLNAKRLQKLGRIPIIDDPEEKLAETVPFDAPIPQNITDEDVINALKNMPESFRQVVLLADVEEFSYKEIATILNIPIGTVMSRLARGRKVLRMELADLARAYGFTKDALSAAG